MFNEIFELIKSNQIVMIVLVIIFTYFVLRVFYMGEQNIIEGLTNNGKSVQETIENIQKNIDSANKSLNELLLVDKYKSDYENLIISLDEAVDKQVVYNLVNALETTKSKSEPLSVLTPELMAKVNDMVNFKTNLNSVMDSLDKATA